MIEIATQEKNWEEANIKITSGLKIWDTFGCETLPALEISGREPWDKSGPETSPALKKFRINPALRHFRPWDMSRPKTSQDKSSSWDISSPVTFVIKSSDIWLKLLLQKKVEKKPTLNYRKRYI
jgi:hypothetical protein